VGPGQCNEQGTAQYGVSNVGVDWNDIISSARGENICYIALYEHADFAGAVVFCTPECPNLVDDGFNDKASSIIFY
jgi:hypothetical protein